MVMFQTFDILIGSGRVLGDMFGPFMLILRLDESSEYGCLAWHTPTDGTDRGAIRKSILKFLGDMGIVMLRCTIFSLQ